MELKDATESRYYHYRESQLLDLDDSTMRALLARHCYLALPDIVTSQHLNLSLVLQCCHTWHHYSFFVSVFVLC